MSTSQAIKFPQYGKSSVALIPFPLNVFPNSYAVFFQHLSGLTNIHSFNSCVHQRPVMYYSVNQFAADFNKKHQIAFGNVASKALTLSRVQLWTLQ